jgi:hypothetical protein
LAIIDCSLFKMKAAHFSTYLRFICNWSYYFEIT